PARTQGLIAAVRLGVHAGHLGTTLQDLMTEIGAASGKDQRDAFQLLATHSLVLAELIGHVRRAPSAAPVAPPAVCSAPPQGARPAPPPAGTIAFRCPRCS